MWEHTPMPHVPKNARPRQARIDLIGEGRATFVYLTREAPFLWAPPSSAL